MKVEEIKKKATSIENILNAQSELTDSVKRKADGELEQIYSVLKAELESFCHKNGLNGSLRNVNGKFQVTISLTPLNQSEI